MTRYAITVGFVGCGNMAAAILRGLLSAEEDGIERIIACTKSEGSALKLQKEFGAFKSVVTRHDDTVNTMKDSDVVVLGFKPYMAASVLGDSAVQAALRGKTVISLLAGVSTDELRSLMGSEDSPETSVAKAIPNIAASYGQSMTILEIPPVALSEFAHEFVEWMFRQVGDFKWLQPELVDAGAMVMTSVMGPLSVAFEGILDGGVVEGLRRNDASDIATQAVKSFAAMLANGTHPALMRESMSSPRGCTIASLMTVEKAATRAVFAQAMIDGSRHFKK